MKTGYPPKGPDSCSGRMATKDAQASYLAAGSQGYEPQIGFIADESTCWPD